MATISGERIFIDTNILVYANISGSPFHELARQCLEDLSQNQNSLWISRQILREYLAIMTRPGTFSIALTPTILKDRIHCFEEIFEIAEDGPAITDELLKIIEEYPVGGKQIHDANIVATMHCHEIMHILTCNIGDFRRFADRIHVLSLKELQI